MSHLEELVDQLIKNLQEHNDNIDYPVVPAELFKIRKGIKQMKIEDKINSIKLEKFTLIIEELLYFILTNCRIQDISEFLYMDQKQFRKSIENRSFEKWQIKFILNSILGDDYEKMD